VARRPAKALSNVPPPGSTVLHVQKSAIGWVLAEANHQVVYTYSKDKKGGKPTCTGACADTWIPATGPPRPGRPTSSPGSSAW
jgi:predicted lipoprotein with Yx(FWY)xxD motif